MDSARPPLISFYCTCGTPLSAPVGAAGIVCHVCGVRQNVPTVTPAPLAGPAPADLAARQQRNTRGVIALVLGGLAVLGAIAFPHNVVDRGPGQSYISDGPVQMVGMLGLGLVGGVLVIYGLVMLLSGPRPK